MIRTLVIKSENRKDKTVVLLIDFAGAPVLGDEYVNNRRYSELQRLALGNNIDKEKLIIVTNIRQYQRDKEYDNYVYRLYGISNYWLACETK